MILQSELIAALKALGIDTEVQASLAGIPVEITKVRLDESRGLIFLDLGKGESEDALRRFLGRVSEALGGHDHAVHRDSDGHLRLLHGGE